MGVLNKMMGAGRGEALAGEQVLSFDDLDPRDVPAPRERDEHAAEHGGSTLTQAESSLLSESAATGAQTDFGETQVPLGGIDAAASGGGTGLPLIGGLSLARQQRILLALVAIGLLGLVVMIFTSLGAASRGAAQVGASGQALMQSQRLAKSVSQALLGSAPAFAEVRDSSNVLAATVRGLKNGGESLAMAPAGVQDALDAVLPFVDRAEKNADTVLAQQKVLTQVGGALRNINRQSAELLESTETIQSLKLQQNAPAAELSAVGQLVMLTQRIGKSANEFLTTEGVSPEAVFLLGKDLNTFRDVATGLLEGSPELRLAPARDAQTRERLAELLKQYEATRVQASAILGNLQGMVSARST
jgi:twitching motility protein PilJ